MVEYLALKLVLMFVIFCEGLVGGILPIVQRLTKHPNTIHYLNSFGGGVIFSVGLIHLMKEGNDRITESCGETGCIAAYPFIILVMSYLMMLFFMKVLTSHSHAHTSEEEREGNLAASAPLENQLEQGAINPADPSPTNSTPNASHSKTESSIYHAASSEAVGIMTFLSLSVHGVFLGLALGLDSQLTGIVNTAIGILAHKWADTLALSFVLRRSKSKYIRPCIMVPMQSMVTPIGIIVGMFISEAENLFVEGFFLCMTAGCFIYFFASDIVVEVFEGNGKLLKFGLVLLGVSIFTVAVSVGEHYSGER